MPASEYLIFKIILTVSLPLSLLAQFVGHKNQLFSLAQHYAFRAIIILPLAFGQVSDCHLNCCFKDLGTTIRLLIYIPGRIAALSLQLVAESIAECLLPSSDNLSASKPGKIENVAKSFQPCR